MLRQELDACFRDFREAIDRLGSRDELAEHHDPAVAALAELTEKEPEEVAAEGVIVIPSIGNDTTAEGKRVSNEFQRFIGRPLPLHVTPDLAKVRTRLIPEFPYATRVVDEILKGLTGRRHVWLRPTILLGPPGCGKTHFLKMLVVELGTPSELIPCGGLSDSAIGGTARRWSSGEPSLAVATVRRHESAGPAIILDEIDKAGTGRHNGNVHDALLGLFERETASVWVDPYVEAACDLSHISWLMTANEVGAIPSVLRDRCQIIRFPEPTAGQLPLLASRILEQAYVETGHDARWATPLEEVELKALGRFWSGGSIRKLQRLVEKLVVVRERLRVRQ